MTEWAYILGHLEGVLDLSSIKGFSTCLVFWVRPTFLQLGLGERDLAILNSDTNIFFQISASKAPAPILAVLRQGPSSLLGTQSPSQCFTLCCSSQICCQYV
jgi:hypothetical protein